MFLILKVGVWVFELKFLEILNFNFLRFYYVKDNFRKKGVEDFIYEINLCDFIIVRIM